MDAKVKRAEEVARDFIKDVEKKISVNKAVLYGSYAKGDCDDKSDLDIAVFSEDFNHLSFVDATSLLFTYARKYKEVCIEPVGFSDSDLYNDNPFVKEIIRSGKEIKTNE